jgi:tRNA threonylcarbamoyladenosine modification (KEOPS) complex  Pcc1 subunit
MLELARSISAAVITEHMAPHPHRSSIRVMISSEVILFVGFLVGQDRRGLAI